MRDNTEVLRQIPLFSSLPSDALSKLNQIAQEKFYPANKFLFHENDLGDRAYVIKSGEVMVVKSEGTADETMLGISGPGELIGEMAILEKQARSASVKAIKNTYTLEITAEDFKDLVSHTGVIGYQFLKMLSGRMREAGQDRLEKMANLVSVEREMQIARRIQANFLPTELPQPDGWQIAARFQPARAVGGDFYDAFAVTHDRIGFVMADVCGKGVGAALFTALVRSLLRAFAGQRRSLGRLFTLADDDLFTANRPAKQRRTLQTAGASVLLIVEDTNNYIANTHADLSMFATLFFGVLNPKNGSLAYINAGHNPPLIVNRAGQIKAQLESTGPVVGIIPDADFDIERVRLDPGDVLVTFTDGVPEARNPAGNQFSEARLQALAQQWANVPASVLLDQIESDLFGFIDTAKQFDDITLLAVRRCPDHVDCD
ncbi:MAG: SpoIIE family protein phosphatase [Anaerolineae bacterium]|nr:SpoIIE family protein phosphatase [Anaerolineae bacterium]